MKKKCCYIIKNHDILDPFVIFYVTLSIIIAIFLNLFCFFIWILFHYILEIYKRYLIFNKIDLEDFLIALQHCKIDFVFFFIAWNIESLVVLKGAVALSPLRGIISLEKFFNFFEFLVKVIGFAKTSKGVYQIIKQLKTKEKFLKEEIKFKLKKSDLFALAVVLIISIVSITIHLLNGLNFYEIIKIYIETLFH